MEKKDAKPSVWEVLSKIDCNGHTETKNGLTYLSWAWAWTILKQHYPLATSTIYEDVNGNNYFTDGRTCWVKTGVTVEGLEHIEELPVMDFRMKALPLENVTSIEVNKAIQRSMTKAIARHGLGMYIYAGEDLPAEDDGKETVKPVKKQESKKDPKAAAMQCWNAWRSRPDFEDMKPDVVKSMFAEEVFKITGKSCKDCSASDWDKVAGIIVK